MTAAVVALVLVALAGYLGVSKLVLRAFDRYMNGRRWLPRHALLYATLLALLYTPGCLALDLRHGNELPVPVPAWVALATGSIWGGLLPLCIGWFLARSYVQRQVTPDRGGRTPRRSAARTDRVEPAHDRRAALLACAFRVEVACGCR